MLFCSQQFILFFLGVFAVYWLLPWHQARVGLAIPLTCALASFQTTRSASIAVINESFISVFRLPTTLPAGAHVDHFCDENQQRQMFNFLSSASSSLFCLASKAESFSCSTSLASECGEKSCARG